MKKIWFFTLLFCTLSAAARAEIQPKSARERFEQRLAAIETLIPAWATAQQVADSMIQSGKARIPAFNLQALAKLYSKEDEQFDKIRELAKGLEDALGGYDKWETILKKAKKTGAANETLSRLQIRINEARTALEKRLVDDHWVRKGTQDEDKKPRAQKLREFFASYEWPSREKDRRNVLKRVGKQISKVSETEYDMGLLEHGDGVHELRRTLRWFSIEAQILEGVIAFRPATEACPSEELAPLLTQPIAKSKFATLPEATADACLISRCLFLGVAQWIQTLGDIKDQAEGLNNASGEETSDSVPAELREQADAVYKQIKRTEAAKTIAAELESCR